MLLARTRPIHRQRTVLFYSVCVVHQPSGYIFSYTRIITCKIILQATIRRCAYFEQFALWLRPHADVIMNRNER